MFSFLKPKGSAMNPRKVSDDFAVTGQITPEQMKAVSEAGYRSIICARPDHEEPGQPNFEDVARAAEAEGIQIVHIPVSGMLGEGQIIRFHQAWETMPKPMLGYCRSGARAGSLHATLAR
jgi:uncharacterized protein (TIGR01244 family)